VDVVLPFRPRITGGDADAIVGNGQRIQFWHGVERHVLNLDLLVDAQLLPSLYVPDRD